MPGMLPSPHIPHENVQDGVVPQFVSRQQRYFHGVLSLTEVFLASCHIRRSLPAGDSLQQKSAGGIPGFVASQLHLARPFTLVNIWNTCQHARLAV
jgi:hypothetical protein